MAQPKTKPPNLEGSGQPNSVWSVLELTCAGAIWGFGFVATRWALEVVGPMQLSGLRFLVAAIAGLVLMGTFDLIRYLGRCYRARQNFNQQIMGYQDFWKWWKEILKVVRLALVPGLCLSATLVLQTWGLVHTTATKSAFITCTYVLLVPLLAPLVGGSRPGHRMWIAVIVAFLGVAQMGGIFQSLFSPQPDLIHSERSRLNLGDLLTLGCAIAGALHILTLDRLMKSAEGQSVSSFALNIGQSLIAWVPAAIGAWATGEDFKQSYTLLTHTRSTFSHFTDSSLTSDQFAVIGFLSVTFGSTLIAFALQVRAQKVLSASLAAILFLLEGPFAALFGVILLAEAFLFHHLAGSILIVSAVLLATFKGQPPDPRPRENH